MSSADSEEHFRSTELFHCYSIGNAVLFLVVKSRLQGFHMELLIHIDRFSFVYCPEDHESEQQAHFRGPRVHRTFPQIRQRLVDYITGLKENGGREIENTRQHGKFFCEVVS